MYRKYGSKKTIVDNITFHSKKEANRYCELKLLEKAGKIKDLSLQPKIELLKGFSYNGERIRPIHYIADFRYYIDDIEHIEDTKGYKTKDYIIKKKMFLNLIKDNPKIKFIES